jgi:hypothetical protein
MKISYLLSNTYNIDHANYRWRVPDIGGAGLYNSMDCSIDYLINNID